MGRGLLSARTKEARDQGIGASWEFCLKHGPKNPEMAGWTEEEVDEFLSFIGWQERIDDLWYPTESGFPHCFLWSNGKGRGHQLRWSVDAVHQAWDKYKESYFQRIEEESDG